MDDKNELPDSPKQPDPEKKVRVTLDLTPQLYARLEALETLVEAGSKADVIRYALSLYEYIAKRTRDGYTFRAVARNGRGENLVFFGPLPPPAEGEEK